MGKDSISKNGTRLTALLLAVLISTQHANAYWRWNYDWKTVMQVIANTTAASAVEETHNLTLDEQKKKQERIAEYTTAIHVIRELYKMSMQNTSGFDQVITTIKQEKAAGKATPNADKVLLIPVETAYDKSGNLVRMAHDFSMSSAKLVGGTTSPVELKVIYSHYNK